jgi:hypothetical protein
MHIESIPTAITHCSGGPYQQGGFQALAATLCNLHDVLEVLLHIPYWRVYFTVINYIHGYLS